MTSKRERFLAAARGEQVDRPPVGAWIHYGSSYWTPEQVAEAHLRFYRQYDWDFIKVMDDFRLQVPEGLEEITDPAQLDEVVPDPAASLPNLEKQAEVLQIIRAEAPEAAIIDTIFSPTQTLVRVLGETVIDYFKADPALAHRTTARVAGALARYAGTLASLGTDGLFLAINGASTDATSFGLSHEQFHEWIEPYDIQVLQAAEGLVRIGHLHGEGADPDLLGNYPFEVLNWSDKVSRPTIEETQPKYGWVPMVGMDEINSLYWTPRKARDEILAARKAADDRLIVAPNCTLHSDGSPLVLKALRESVDLPLD